MTTHLASQRAQHADVLLVVPDKHAVTEQLHAVQHPLLRSYGGNVLTSPRDQNLLYATCDEQVTWQGGVGGGTVVIIVLLDKDDVR